MQYKQTQAIFILSSLDVYIIGAAYLYNIVIFNHLVILFASV